ncbi:hypothetical protein CIL05_13955 [Virgibacillus profundi]|uniref:Competence protein ComGF n=1 Tax=Virgibacillus profundi TaxID=2024555 RepID=A0A2A2ICT4_9BACI|nr:ComGF family competence protein [Virgibacillus profundi]PAV29074.1 hypothetical protein CIL05_13955 [Virgibacillus profundi]PXY53243.1 hypothetical protein CIT14_14080 [Virgibacillus profundi]
MSKRKMNHFVYMVSLKNERAFTFISMLLIITVLAVSLPFAAILIKSASYDSNYDELSIQQFFKFLRDDVMIATDYRVSPTILYLDLENNKTATIETYKGVQVRRRIDWKGHDLYLQNIQDLKFEEVPNGIRTTVISQQGEIYEKTIIFYK